MIQLLAQAAPYLLSAGAGLLSGSKKSSPGSAGTIVELPQYSFTEPRLRLISDTVSDMMSRISRGEAPAYYERALPKLRRGMERSLQTTYFGRPGDRTGSVQAALEAGSLAGTGSRPGTANVNRALQRYEEGGQAIDEYLTKLGVDVTTDAYKTSLYAGLQIPKGPDVQAFPGYGPQTSSGVSDALASMAMAMPWLNSMAGTMEGAGGGTGTSAGAPKKANPYQSLYGPGGSMTPGWTPDQAKPYTSSTSAWITPVLQQLGSMASSSQYGNAWWMQPAISMGQNIGEELFSKIFGGNNG